jgi:hypothetical protein
MATSALLTLAGLSMCALARSPAAAQAQLDIERAQTIIRAAHPAGIPGTDREFDQWLSSGYSQALALAEQAKSPSQAFAALTYFLAGFNDDHLVALAPHTDLGPNMWAGWTVQPRGKDLVVTHRASVWEGDLPEIGARLVSCDGQGAAAYIAEHVAPYFDRRLALEGTHARLAALISNQLTAHPPWLSGSPRECVFNARGQAVRIPMAWKKSDEGLHALAHAQAAPGVEKWGAGSYWVYATNFSPDGDQLRLLNESIDAVRTIPVQAPVVVLDTRGNRGGSGLYGYTLLAALMKDATPALGTKAQAYWRVSNIAASALDEGARAEARVAGLDSLRYNALRTTADSLRKALAAGDQSLLKDETASLLPKPPVGAGFRGRVVLVTDSDCSSACLDFVDMVRAVPGLLHVGLPTSGDTNYLEVAPVILPSGVVMRVPLKVWTGRARGVNEPVLPTHRFPGDIRDTSSLRTWLDQVLRTEPAPRALQAK